MSSISKTKGTLKSGTLSALNPVATIHNGKIRFGYKDVGKA